MYVFIFISVSLKLSIQIDANIAQRRILKRVMSTSTCTINTWGVRTCVGTMDALRPLRVLKI